MNPQPDNPTPPTNASESTEPSSDGEWRYLYAKPEPKVQVTTQDKALAQRLAQHYPCSTADWLGRTEQDAQIIAAYVASAVEAARVEADKIGHVANDQFRDKAALIAQLDQARAEVVEMTELRRDALKQWKHFGDAFLVEKARAEKAESSLAALVAARHLTDMRIAAIMTASVQNTESCVKDRIGPDHPYWSQAYADVCAAVDREVVARTKADSLEQDRERLFRAAERAEGMIRGEFHRFNFDPAWAATLGELQRAIKAHHTASSGCRGGASGRSVHRGESGCL